MQACLGKFHHQIEDIISVSVSKIGRKCSQYPYVTVLLSLGVTCACGVGFGQIYVETEGTMLWVPFHSPAYKNWEKQKKLFDNSRYQDFLILDENEGANVLTKKAFDSLWNVHECLIGLSGINERCYKFDPNTDVLGCAMSNALKYWDYNKTKYKMTVTNDEDILKALKTKQYSSGEFTNERFMFGSKREYGGDDFLASSPVMSGFLLVKGEPLEKTKEFEIEYLSCFGISGLPLNPKQDQTYKGIHVFGQATRSLDDELLRIISLDVPLMMLTYVVMIFFACFALSRGLPCTKKANMVLACGGVGAVMLSTVAAYGICAACGIPFTSLQQVLPFILVAIGVDDMFIIVSQFRRLDPKVGSVQDRIEIALNRCAMSITYTTLTDFVAFLAGSTSTLPAIQYFCKYAAVAVLFDYFYQITMFVACLALETKREERNLPDCCCCAEVCKPAEERAASVEAARRASDEAHNVATKIKVEGQLQASKSSAFVAQNSRTKLGAFLEDHYTPFLAKRPVQGAVVLLFLGFTGLNAYFAADKVEEGFDIVDITPDESYMRDYLNNQKDYGLSLFDEYLPTWVYFDNVKYWEAEEQKKVTTALEKVGKSERIEPTQNNWMTGLAEFTLAVMGKPGEEMPEFLETTEANFQMGLDAFIEHHPLGKVYQGDLSRDASGKVVSSRVQFFHPLETPSASDKIKAMDAMYEAIDNSGMADRAWGFTFAYIFITQFKIIYQELLVNFSCCLAAVAAMSFVFIGDLKSIAMFCLIIVMIDIDLIGGMYLWNVYLSSITLINLVMAVGLVVDYLAHLAHFFLLQDPSYSAERRLGRAMGEIGPSVCLGGLTTFLGILPLIAGSSYIFRVFFMMFFDIIVYAMAHALLFLPVLLLIVNPKPPSFHVAKVVPVEDA